MSRSILHLSTPISTTHFPKTSIAPSILFAKPLGAPLLQLQPLILRLSRGETVKCMANQRRVQKVAKQVMREISEMLVTDDVVKGAVLPEYALGADLNLSSLTTVSDVEMSNDLQVAKVYVSVFGDERGRKVAMAGLKAKTGYVRYQLGKRMRLRMVPEVRFIEDDSQERGSRVIAILDRLKREEEEAGNKNDEEGSDNGEEESKDGDIDYDDDSDYDNENIEEYEEDDFDSDDEKEDPKGKIIYVD